MHVHERERHGCLFERFGETWKRAILRPFGHMFRAHPSDPMKQVSLAAEGCLSASRKTKSRPDHRMLWWFRVDVKNRSGLMQVNKQTKFRLPSDDPRRVRSLAVIALGSFVGVNMPCSVAIQTFSRRRRRCHFWYFLISRCFAYVLSSFSSGS